MRKNDMLSQANIEFLAKIDPYKDRPLHKVTKEELQKLKTMKGVDKKIMEIFLTVGISAHLQGYKFLREAIKLTMDDPDYMSNITKGLYPDIANKFETSPCRVERGIRHAIDVSFSKGKMIHLNKLFGLEVLRSDEKPTNSEFVALIADKLLHEDLY